MKEYLRYTDVMYLMTGHPHTEVDIFGKVGTPVMSQTGGILLYADDMPCHSS